MKSKMGYAEASLIEGRRFWHWHGGSVAIIHDDVARDQVPDLRVGSILRFGPYRVRAALDFWNSNKQDKWLCFRLEPFGWWLPVIWHRAREFFWSTACRLVSE